MLPKEGIGGLSQYSCSFSRVLEHYGKAGGHLLFSKEL